MEKKDSFNANFRHFFTRHLLAAPVDVQRLAAFKPIVISSALTRRFSEKTNQ